MAGSYSSASPPSAGPALAGPAPGGSAGGLAEHTGQRVVAPVQDVGCLQPHQVLPGPGAVRVGGQPAGVPEPGPFQLVPHAAGVAEVRQVDLALEVVAEGPLGGLEIGRAHV